MSIRMNVRLVGLILPTALILSGCASYKADTVDVESKPNNTVATSDPAPVLQDDGPIPFEESADAVLPRDLGAGGCRAAAAAAEKESQLPPGLLTAIAKTESGMRSTALRVAGRGMYPATTQAAKSIARQALSRSESVMAGCMQVNLRVHDPKGELWALEPDKAANWAADYLTTLHDRLGSWRQAVKVYGGDPGRSYVRRIERRMDGGLPDEVAEAP
jgi:hypothetical protein